MTTTGRLAALAELDNAQQRLTALLLNPAAPRAAIAEAVRRAEQEAAAHG